MNDTVNELRRAREIAGWALEDAEARGNTPKVEQWDRLIADLDDLIRLHGGEAPSHD